MNVNKCIFELNMIIAGFEWLAMKNNDVCQTLHNHTLAFKAERYQLFILPASFLTGNKILTNGRLILSEWLASFLSLILRRFLFVWRSFSGYV